MIFDPGARADPQPDAVLLPTQAAFVVDPEPFKLLVKGRRTGGSWAVAYGAAERVSSRRDAGGMNVYYIPQTYEDAVEFIEACGKWLQALDVAAGAIEHGTYADELDMPVSPIFGAEDPDKAIKTYVIRVPATGFRVVALSASPARIRGKQGLIIFDEAAFHRDFSAVLKSAMAMILRGGLIWVLSTHNGDGSAFNAAIEAVSSGERRGKVFSYPFRQAVREGMYHRICAMRGEEWTQAKEDAWVAAAYEYYGDDAGEELDAIPSSGEGAYLPAVLIDRAMVDAPVLRWSFNDAFNALPEPERRRQVARRIEDELDPLLQGLPEGKETVYGMDFARVAHLSVIAPAVVEQSLHRSVPFVIELRHCPTRQQEQILWHLIENLHRMYAGAMDATGNGETISEYTQDKFGSRIEPVKLNEAFYGAHFPALKESFEDNLLTIPRDKDIRRDLRQIHKVRGIPKIGGEEYEGSDRQKRHGDSAIALLLMDYAARRDIAPIEFTRVPSKHERWDGGGGADIAGSGGGAW